MKLTNNYTLAEFTRSAAAEKHYHTIVMPNEFIPRVQALCDNVLQPINDYTGWTNVISSGLRDDFINKLVGGVDTSMHKTAEASDNNFQHKDDKGNIVHVSPIEVAKVVVKLGLTFDQMILYPNFIHLSYTTRRDNRMQILYSKSYKGDRL